MTIENQFIHMKNTIKILLLLILGSAGCDMDEWLDEVNTNDLSAASFWQNEEQLSQGLVATYGVLQFEGVMGGTASTQYPVRSDVGRPNNWNSTARSLQALSFNDNTAVVTRAWNNLYEGVYRANQVLDNLPNIEMEESNSTLYEAEARFLRGVFYYWLYRGYNEGSVVLHSETPKSEEDFNKPLAPASEVYDLVESDLQFAAANLPEVWGETQQGRATWGAAMAMLGKLYINEREYATALTYFKSLVDRPDLYQLTPHIGWNFDEEHEFNSESIFEVSFSTSFKEGNANNATDGATGSEATSRARILGTTNAGGWRIIMPSYWVTMLFKEEELDLSDPRNIDRVYSIRASESIAIADDTYSTLYQKPTNEGGAFNNTEASYLKKFQNWKKEEENPLTISGINERVVRLADIYLLYAETLLQTGGDFNLALDLVNQIRARSGVVQLNAAEHTPTSLMEHIMWEERPLELMFEGRDIRWEDLTRWGKVKEQYDRLAAMRFTLDGQNIRWYEPGDEGNFPIVSEYIEAAAVYSEAIHDYFPIPATEQISNNNLQGE